jgi:RND superfamily putative drug exporter
MEDHRLFATLGRATVRYRWLIIAGWIIVAVALATCLPSLSTVEKNSNSDFLPANSPSVVASELATPFTSTSTQTVTYIASTSHGPLTAADTAAIDRTVQAIRSVPGVTAVINQETSPDGAARQALVEMRIAGSSSGQDAVRLVTALRSTFAASGAPAALAMHLTGGVASSVDEQDQNGHIQTLTEILSLLFIVALLFLTFRALLAPVIALLPSVVSLVAAGPIIAASTHLGVQVSDLTPILLIVVILGAGTDYGLFLIFRVREELRRGKDSDHAVAFSLCKVGESITFSGLTVMGALATVAISSFGFYQGLGPALAIGIAVALLANLTLLPALLAVLGRSVFWPRIPRVAEYKGGAWGRIAGRVVGKPVLTLVIGLVIFGGLAMSMLAYSPTGFSDQPAPATSDSGRGQAALVAHFPTAETDPTSVLFRFATPIWSHPSSLEVAQQGLVRSGKFTTVTGALNPDGVDVAPAALAESHAQLSHLGAASQLPAVPPPGTTVPADAYLAYQSSAQYISAEGRTVQFQTGLVAGPATSTTAASAMPAVRAAVERVGLSVGASANGVNGDAPEAADVGSIAGHDLVKIIPIVMLVLALLLAIVLRSLIAPLYLVVSVGLSYLASLGLAVLVFVIIGGQDGINFVLPFFMFVFIMALGQDYNILVMTRIREEAHHAPIRVAVRRAVQSTGTTVTSAGLILAGTFGVLTATGDTQVQEIGLGLAAGILLDTFFVRTLLVPSTVVLLGRWNWWPSGLSHEDHSHDPVTPEDDEDDGGSAAAEPLVRHLAGTPR